MTTQTKATPAKKITKTASEKPIAKESVATKPTVETKAPTPKAQPVVEPTKSLIDTNAKTATKSVEASAKVAKKSVKKTTDASKEQIASSAKVGAETFKSYEDMIALSKENIEAIVQSNGIYSKGFQQINETFLKLVQDNVAQTVDYTKKIMTCTSIEDAVALQQELATAQYSKAVEESQLLSDMTVKLAEKASKPISDRVNVTIETLTKPIAA